MTLTVDRIDDIYSRFVAGKPVAHAEWEDVFVAAKAWAEHGASNRTCAIKSVNGVPFVDGDKTGVCQ